MLRSRIIVSILVLCTFIVSTHLIGCKKDKERQAKQKDILGKIIIPPPNMIFSALQRSGSIKWKSIITYNDETNYTSFEKITLNLGARVADGFVAIMAEDKANMNKMGKAIKTLSKKIGIGDKVLQRAGEIEIDDKLGTWKKNEAKFNEIYSNIIMELEKREDYEVSYFCNLGAWLEALYISSKSLNSKYNAAMAENMRQKALLDVFLEGYEVLSDKAKEKKIVILLKEKLLEIGKLIDFPQGKSLSKANSMRLYEVSKGLKAEIEKM